MAESSGLTFGDESVNGETCLSMLKDCSFPHSQQMNNHDVFFMHDGALPNHATSVRMETLLDAGSLEDEDQVSGPKVTGHYTHGFLFLGVCQRFGVSFPCCSKS